MCAGLAASSRGASAEAGPQSVLESRSQGSESILPNARKIVSRISVDKDRGNSRYI